MKRFAGLAIIVLSIATARTAHAQFETATVLGTVRDASNAVVPEATVTLTQHGHRRVDDEERQTPKATTSSSPSARGGI